MTKRFDLEERTEKFGSEVVRFCRKIEINTITRPLVSQFIRSATSVGANYMEANGADSKKDFKNKIGICKKEAKETMHWCKMMTAAVPGFEEVLSRIWKEAKELSLIFGAINRK